MKDYFLEIEPPVFNKMKLFKECLITLFFFLLGLGAAIVLHRAGKPINNGLYIMLVSPIFPLLELAHFKFDQWNYNRWRRNK